MKPRSKTPIKITDWTRLNWLLKNAWIEYHPAPEFAARREIITCRRDIDTEIKKGGTHGK